MGEHRQEFQRELEDIEAKVIELFAMVAEDLPTATHALLTGNNEAAQILAERDQVIDALYTETDELVSREILLQAPVASDLRFLLSVLRIVPEIERSHDLVVEIARQADHLLNQDLSPRSRGLVERMGDLASNMWRQAADAWYKRDRTAGFALSSRDDEMDELHASPARRAVTSRRGTCAGKSSGVGARDLRVGPREVGHPAGDVDRVVTKTLVEARHHRHLHRHRQ